MPTAYYKSSEKDFSLLKGDCIELLNLFDFNFDMIFADPPYHLSNDGISIQSGKPVSVNKGNWDKSNGFEADYKFDKAWLTACREHLKSDGTIWVSGTYHNIFSVARCLTELNFKILNCITWVKTNPPPNLSCRYFTYSAEYILWARKEHKVAHFYNYELMKAINGGTQMRDVWTLPAIATWEKSCGSSTTGIAANLLGRRFLGIDQDAKFLEMSRARREELYSSERRNDILEKLDRQSKIFRDSDVQVLYEPKIYYGPELPF